MPTQAPEITPDKSEQDDVFDATKAIKKEVIDVTQVEFEGIDKRNKNRHTRATQKSLGRSRQEHF